MTHWNYRHPRLYTALVWSLAPAAWAFHILACIVAFAAYPFVWLSIHTEPWRDPRKLTTFLWENTPEK